ncbi:MAG: hypothetical protein ACK5W1_13945 [Flavobacteriales bacterium]
MGTATIAVAAALSPIATEYTILMTALVGPKALMACELEDPPQGLHTGGKGEKKGN